MKKTIKQHSLAAAALTGGLVGTGHAATVQITLTGNMISTNGGIQLLGDLTGDGTADVVFANPLIRLPSTAGGYADGVRVTILGAIVRASPGSRYYLRAQFANGGVGIEGTVYAYVPGSINYLNPITFTDARINGGATTNGYLQVNAFNTSRSNHTVALTRLVFDDASTIAPTGLSTGTTYTPWVVIPEVSSLGLLALGAGGLAFRRNRKQAA